MTMTAPSPPSHPVASRLQDLGSGRNRGPRFAPFRAAVRVFALASVVWVAGCGGFGDPYTGPMSFDTAQVVVQGDDARGELLVEVAETEDQMIRGLTGRDGLDPDSGMLFVFDHTRAADEGFWMWRTRIPLDIAFLDDDGVILRLLSMEPCPEVHFDDCTHYTPGVEYEMALEANQGWFADQGLGEGDRVEVHR